MNYTKEDVGKYVVLEVGIEDLGLLRDLFKYETLIQYTATVQSGIETLKKVDKIVSISEAYRDIDDQLIDLSLSITESMKKQKIDQLGLKIKNLIVIHRPICMLYKFLCTDTVAAGLPDDIQNIFTKSGSGLLSRIDLALLKDYTLDEIKGKPIVRPASAPESDDLIKINILGIKGIA